MSLWMVYTKRLMRAKRVMKSGKRIPRPMKSTVKKIATQVMRKHIETKVAGGGEENLSLYHNGAITSAADSQPLAITNLFNIWSQIVSGTNSNSRVGTEIIPRGMSIRLYLENLAGRPFLHYRIICGFAPKQRTDGVATAYNNLQVLSAASNGNLLRHTSQDLGYKVVYDRIFRNECNGGAWTGSEQGVTAGSWKRNHLFKKIWIRPTKNGRIVYNGAATGVVSRIVNKPFFMCVIPYDSQNTLSTDEVARLSYSFQLYFKDA